MKGFLLFIIVLLLIAVSLVYAKVYSKAKDQCASGHVAACQIMQNTFNQ